MFHRESPLHAVLTVGPSDLARLKEKAGENSRLKDKMEALKEDVSVCRVNVDNPVQLYYADLVQLRILCR